MTTMIRSVVITSLLAGVIPAMAWSHGPQLQITIDAGQIVTREVILDGPYSDSVTTPKRVFVMPLSVYSGATYSHPNPEVDSVTGVSLFPSGPGLAYGADLTDGGPQTFEAGSILTLSFADGFKKWNGTTFGDAGDAQLKAFRGSDVSIATPVENFAVTSDAEPYDQLSLAPIVANYGTDGSEAHASIRFAVLGDGASPSSVVGDGIYLATLQLASTQPGLSASEPYYFVLYQDASLAAITSAAGSLGTSTSQIQFVPEPAGDAMALFTGLVAMVSARRGRRRR